MTKLTLPFLLVALAASAPAAPVPSEANAPMMFSPTTRGSAWEYESGDAVLKWVVTDVTPAGKSTRVTVRRGETGHAVMALRSFTLGTK